MRIGIVGAGLMGQWHAHAAHHAKADIVAIADVDMNRARHLASKYKAVAYVSVGELLENANISVLHICTPASEHLPIAFMAIEHDKHLMVEKPLATNLVDTRWILKKATSSQKLVCPTHQYAFQRSINTITDQIDRVGEVISVDLMFCTAGGGDLSPSSFPLLAADILPHPLSILQRMFPTHQLMALKWRLASSINGDWEISTQIESTRIRIILSLLTRPTIAAITVAGTKGSFEADLFHDYGVWSGGEATRSTKILRPFKRSLAHLWSASQNLVFRAVSSEPAYPGLKALTSKFYEACQAGAKRPVSDRQMVDIAAMRDQFLQATQLGQDSLTPVVPMQSFTS